MRNKSIMGLFTSADVLFLSKKAQAGEIKILQMEESLATDAYMIEYLKKDYSDDFVFNAIRRRLNEIYSSLNNAHLYSDSSTDITCYGKQLHSDLGYAQEGWKFAFDIIFSELDKISKTQIQMKKPLDSWTKINEKTIDLLDDGLYYLAFVEGIATPVKVKFKLDAESGFKCNINDDSTVRFIPLDSGKVKYIMNLPELPREE